MAMNSCINGNVVTNPQAKPSAVHAPCTVDLEILYHVVGYN